MKFHLAYLDELEVTAKAATPGPWTEDDCNVFSQELSRKTDEYVMEMVAGTHPDCDHQDTRDSQPSRPDPFICTTQQRTNRSWEDAKFISVFNPELCMRMIARLRALERRIDDA